MPLNLVSAPASEPVTVAEVKDDARVDGNAFDSRITTLIAAAREMAEFETGRALITQTWQLQIDDFYSRDIQIGKLPIGSISSVKYYDSDNTLQTLSSAYYELDAVTLPGWLRLAPGYSWPTTYDKKNAVQIEFIAGYGEAGDVPQAIKNWIRARAATMVDNPTAIDPTGKAEELPRTFIDGLLDPYRLHLRNLPS